MKFDDAGKFKSVLLIQQINRALTFFPTFSNDFGFNCKKNDPFFYFKD